MLQIIHRNTAIMLLIVAVVIVGAMILIAAQATSAQDLSRNNNMRQLLETLNSKIENEAPFQVGFRFANPLMDIDELYWEIPYSTSDREVSRWIGEIGDDFICFYEMAGSSNIGRCTPFSNIVSVSYVGNS